MKIYHSTIEPLESRIAPAAVFVNATTATYTDVDGDHVTVKFSLPILTQGNVTTVLETAAVGSGDQLQEINFTGVVLPVPTPPLSIAVSAVKVAHGSGDGLVNVGLIDATGVNLGVVTVKGDLGAIEAGDGSTTMPATAALDVRSMGAYGTATQAATSPTLKSTIEGTLTALNVSGDVTGAYIDVAGTGNIGSITIRGSLIGGSATNSGTIATTGTGFIGAVKIGGDIRGGSGNTSGQINSGGAITSLTLGGSLIGGATMMSGYITSAGAMGAIKIGKDVVGGEAPGSGEIYSQGAMTSLTVVGNMIGGASNSSGSVFATDSLGPAKVGGSLIGEIGEGSGGIISEGIIASLTVGGSLIGGPGNGAGTVESFGTMGSVTVAGSVIGGSAVETGEIFSNLGNMGIVKIGGSLIGEGAGVAIDSGEISSDGTLTSVTIGGSVIGGAVSQSGYITSFGAMGAVRIGKDIVGGGVSNTDTSSGEINSLGAMGPVTVGGSVTGGTASYSGEILSSGTMGAVRIGGSLVGGPTQDSGGIQAHGDLAAVTIGGSVYSGTALFTGEIESEATLGPVTIRGNVAGNANDPVLIRGQGALNAAMTTDIAIASLSVGGRVEDALILAGFGGGNSPQSGDAQIGAVRVGGDWIASSMSAGCEDTASGGISGGFGNPSDIQIATLPGGSIDSRIASITIGGTIIGEAGAGDHFGFDAQKIGSFSYSGTAIALPATQPPAIDETIPLSPTTGDVFIDLVS